MSSSVKNPTSFRRFALSALPEFWMFQLLASLFLFPLSRLVWRFVRALTAKSGALTSSNYLRFLASWRAPVLLVLLFLLVMLYLLFELLAPIFLCNALLSGKQLRYRTALLDGLRSLRKFASPRGLLFLFYLAAHRRRFPHQPDKKAVYSELYLRSHRYDAALLSAVSPSHGGSLLARLPHAFLPARGDSRVPHTRRGLSPLLGTGDFQPATHRKRTPALAPVSRLHPPARARSL